MWTGRVAILRNSRDSFVTVDYPLPFGSPTHPGNPMNTTQPAGRAPTEILLHSKSRRLELRYADGSVLDFTYEFLRVHSPSAEVRGHGPGQEVLQTGKKDVEIVAIEPVGTYGIQPRFSDGHDSGIFSWEYLGRIGRDRDKMWSAYLAKLAVAGASREPG